MILTLIFVGLTVLGIILIKLYWSTDIHVDLESLGLALTSIFGIASICALTIILINHVGVNDQIEKNRIKYESLIARQEIVRSDYEDVSKSDVIKDIAEWNMKVQSSRYWGYNPWTNWFYSKRVTDALKFIE